MTKTVERGPVPAQRRDRVEICEGPNLRPWTGTVMSVKPSSVSGWWLDVREDDSPMTRVVHESHIVRVMEGSEEG